MAKPDSLLGRAERAAQQRATQGAGRWAATVVSDCVEGQPARFTLDHGDGTVCRGPWDCRDAPVAGDSVAVLQLDDGSMWVVARWPTA